ncbi:MAG: hypothetical protein LBK41_01750 [Clostridiales bacterium]|nr:hypothetical protein [Clostridiales bacterium]
MTFEQYKSVVRGKLPPARITREERGYLTAYEEFFKVEWLLTKLKITSFVTYAPAVDAAWLRAYSEDCLKTAIKTSPGLPRGWQNGVVSCAVAASERVSPDAAAFASARPSKHYSAFEYPAVFDLSNGRLLFYRGSIAWGSLYEGFLRNYMEYHFGA